MALFDEAPARPRRRSRSMVAGIWAATVALVALFVLTILPTSFVIQQPGPVFNTLGTATGADGEELPLISVEGAETFAAEGSLDLLTVQVRGNRESTPSWLDLAAAWLDTSRAVVPLDQVFPVGQTQEERKEQNSALMVDSQHEATAAALLELGYDVDARIVITGFTEDSPSAGVLEDGDIVRAADGTPVDFVEDLRSIINAGGGTPVELTVERDGALHDVTVTPVAAETDGATTWLIGVTTMRTFDFPIDVTIQLDNVGGPSAGMMFALGIIDLLTPGDLTGGHAFAGTGTIDAHGEVGPIGGIRQKMHGALSAGADYMLAPLDNCGEVVGNVPGGLRVFAVETLDEALEVLETVREDGDLDALPTCTTAAAPTP
ncbi:YlbL family protein [Microbacterium sp. No. 7]|uniref:YlbL family protein n=1 Tax=Microbacterium sp. No. 7 TaxID=1714373 RepID=UPI0006D0CB34|nr:S16 family serine protease [Microbacterium sp. No. 7]ALJ19968.1 ATP-dependent serine peptidase containing a PDZ domain protein [Microbacterium sp. No. 7]